MVKEVVRCGSVGGSGTGADGALVYLSVSVWEAEREARGDQSVIYISITSDGHSAGLLFILISSDNENNLGHISIRTDVLCAAHSLNCGHCFPS